MFLRQNLQRIYLLRSHLLIQSLYLLILEDDRIGSGRIDKRFRLESAGVLGLSQITELYLLVVIQFVQSAGDLLG